MRPRPGRPPGALRPGEEIWLVGEGAGDSPVLATPLDGRPAGRAARVAEIQAGSSLALPRLWVAEHVSRTRAERLIAAGEAFADGVGNAHLRLPGLIAHVLGHEPLRKRKKERSARTAADRPQREWRSAALRALFPLLCDPTLAERPVREVAAVAGTAPGTIVQLLSDLEDTGELVNLEGRRRRFVPGAELAARWMVEYARKLRPRLLIDRFEPAASTWWKGLDVTRHAALWGGESAAELLGADLRPGLRTLYVRELAGDFLREAKLRRDPDGTVELRRIVWRGSLPAPRPDVTPPLLVVADLLATRDGRCRAAAATLQETYLAGLYQRP